MLTMAAHSVEVNLPFPRPTMLPAKRLPAGIRSPKQSSTCSSTSWQCAAALAHLQKTHRSPCRALVAAIRSSNMLQHFLATTKIQWQQTAQPTVRVLQ